jgi:hypothetical protein
MTIRFICGKCGKGFQLGDELAGRKAKCTCGHVQQVPEPNNTTMEFEQQFSHSQQLRTQRINADLQRLRGAPIYPAPLWDQDESQVQLRTAAEVVGRVYALWAASMRGENVPADEIWSMIDRQIAWPAASPSERRFIDNRQPDPDEAQQMVWRLEAMWVLMWALGKIDDLGWPEGMCDVKKLMGTVIPYAHDRRFASNAALRPKSEILDAYEITLRLHWALRDAYLNQRPIPANLNWLKPSKMVPAAPTVCGAVLEQRHHAFNWLIRFGDADWDDVDTPT